MNQSDSRSPKAISEQVALLGIPYDKNSSYLRGAALAPFAIRKALTSASTNLSTESGLDLGTDDRWKDFGNVAFDGPISHLELIEHEIAALIGEGFKIASLGGDHSVSYPCIRAYAEKYKDLTVLQLDAHPDLYDEFEGNRYSNACPFARVMEEGLIKDLIQVGIRTMNPHQREQAERFGVHTIDARNLSEAKMLRLQGPVYLSLDLDVLDPAFAPGVSHPEPGGLTTRDVLTIIQRLSGTLVGADIVELNPTRDPTLVTAMVAAKCAKETIASLLGK